MENKHYDVAIVGAGIAGIILSIGMAVDANVIIFERIKEELKSGKTLGASLKAGFNRAISAILDGQITTAIAAVVLFIFGTGTIVRDIIVPSFSASSIFRRRE